jgi:hypothetical protein
VCIFQSYFVEKIARWEPKVPSAPRRVQTLSIWPHEQCSNFALHNEFLSLENQQPETNADTEVVFTPHVRHSTPSP